MKTMSIDIETRSSVDLGKCGVYKYVESPDFDILLFGCSVNGGPVRVYDLASGEELPEEIIEALEKRSRVIVVSAEEGLGSTAELMEYAKELGRNRNDLYEIPVWRESINVVGNELFYMQAVHQESDVIPENIDAIRALLEMESDNEKSIAKTNKAMGIF